MVRSVNPLFTPSCLDETSWLKALKREILKLFSFEVDKNGDGMTEVKWSQSQVDFSSKKFTIPGYKSALVSINIRSLM